MPGNFHGTLDHPGALDRHAAGDFFLDFLRCRADQKRKNGLLTQRLLQRGVIAAFVFPAQNDQDSPGKSIQGLQRGIHVGRLRVVEIAHTPNFRDKLEAMLDPREGAHSFGDSRGSGPGETRRGHGRKDVFDIVCTHQRNFLEIQYQLFFAVMAKHDFVFPHEHALRHALLPAEPVDVRLLGRQGRGRRIIRVQHRAVRFRLIFEDSRFGAAIRLELVMPV